MKARHAALRGARPCDSVPGAHRRDGPTEPTEWTRVRVAWIERIVAAGAIDRKTGLLAYAVADPDGVVYAAELVPPRARGPEPAPESRRLAKKARRGAKRRWPCVGLTSCESP